MLYVTFQNVYVRQAEFLEFSEACKKLFKFQRKIFYETSRPKGRNKT